MSSWEENPKLYDVARQVCHDFGIPWTDPRTGVTHEPPKKVEREPSSQWRWNERDQTWEIDGRDCWIWMNARPPYCDRGRWLANLSVRPGAYPLRLSIDSADGWPRYYFDLKRAMAEVEEWLVNRRQWIVDDA